jgi:tetratricopeptide (TPR) repeat protein
MSATTIDWDQDVAISKEESYQSLQNALNRNQGFGLYFVRSSPVQTQAIIEDIKRDLPNKNIGILPLTDEIDNLFNLITNLLNYQNLNILFISGLELSLLRYEERESEGLFLSSQSAVYGGTWAGVPRILGHLNLSRERFREHFPFSIVFCLPEFALRYFIRRAPDFFDWRSGVYEFPTERESVNSEIYRLLFLEGGDLQKYQTWTEQERLQRLTEIRAYLSESPDNERSSELWNEKGLIHAVNDQFEEAITSFGNALKIKPHLYEACTNRGVVLFNLGKYEEAITYFDNALKIQPHDPDAWYDRGNALRELGRYEEAITSYDQALKFKPDDHKACTNRGLTLFNLVRYEEAIFSYDQALKFKSDDHKAWYNRGNALDYLGRLEEAIFSFDQALKFKFDYHEAWVNRGVALENLGRYEEAITSHDQALKFKPDLHEAWNNRGNVLTQLDRLEEAITSYAQALKFKPDFYEALDNRGIALLKLGRYDEVILSCDKCLEIKPDYANTYYNKACAYALQEKIDLAIENLKQAINLDSEYLAIAKTDTDFDKIRSDCRFINLLNIEY